MTRLDLALQGNLQADMRRDAKRLRTATGKAVRAITREAQLEARQVINQKFRGSARVAGGNRRVANAVRSKIYDDNGQTTGLIYSKFGRGRGAGFVDYLLPYVEGATLRPKKKQWLYVPIEKRGKRGVAARRRPDVDADPKLAFVKGKGGRVFIIRKTRTRSILVAVLVRELRIGAKFDFDSVERRVERDLPRRLLEALETVSDTKGAT